MTHGHAFSLPSAFAAVVLACSASVAATDDDAPLRHETGQLQQLIARLAGEQYMLDEPAKDERPYVDPSPLLNAFRHAAAELAWGNPEKAARRAAEFDYEVVHFTDEETSREYLVLRENLERSPACRGWGSYIVNPDSDVNALVEVPHPLADAQTSEIGGLVFEQSAARGFLLAGAHRIKADVRGLVDSVFHQVHVAWVGANAQVAAWQIHGFAAYKHSFPHDARVIASTGDGTVTTEMASLDALFDEQGLPSYVYNERPAESRANQRLNGGLPGAKFRSLAALGNEQGRYSRNLGGQFVHVELETEVRRDAAQRETAAAVIAAVMSGAYVAQDLPLDDDEIELVSLETDAEQSAAPPVERVARAPTTSRLAPRRSTGPRTQRSSTTQLP